MVRGDEVIVEMRCSAEFMKSNILVMSRVNHDFVDIRKTVESGSCNLDVNCGSEDGWEIVDGYRDIINSVGAYTLNGIDQCSGALINNTAQDCKPFFLTADHCQINPSNAASVVVFWNYQNSYCRQPNSIDSGRPGDGSRSDFNSGAILRASLGDSDVALIELDDPIDPSLNLYFAGWDLSSELTDTSICIHHPNVEEKRISFDFDRLRYDLEGSDTTYLRVLDWDIGTTEGGSSGSPIFNSDKKIIGQLFGGLAACGNNEYDIYGWLRYSWESGNGISSNLKPWLDPLNTGQQTLDGRSCTFNLDASSYFVEYCSSTDDGIEIELVPSDFFQNNLNYSVDVSDGNIEFDLAFTQGNSNQVNVLNLSGLDDLSTGSYFVYVNVNDGTNTAEATIEIDLYEQMPNVPELDSPAHLSENVSTNIELRAKRTINSFNFFELATDAEFDNIVFEASSSNRFVPVSGLMNDTEYFWRVRSENPCGTSDWSETFSFITANPFCTVLSSLDGPKEISSNGSNIVRSIINVPYPVVAEELNILNVKGTHSFISDLEFRLRFNNNSAVLMSQVCEDATDFDLGFDDESPLKNINCPPTDALSYAPVEPLETFRNQVAGGEWTLQIDDLFNFDGGVFESWTMELCFIESAAAALVPTNNRIKYCEGQNAEFTVFVDPGSGVSDFEIRAYDRNNLALDIDLSSFLSELSTMRVSLDTELLSSEEENVRLELVALSDQNVLAVSPIILVKGESVSDISISSPINGEVIRPEEFSNISWSGPTDEQYHVQIAEDEAFNDIIFSAQTDGNILDVSGIVFDNNEYYLRILSERDCGEISSETIRFNLDINSSSAEVWEEEMQVFPNPTNAMFYLTLPEAYNKDEIKIDVFDVNGQRIFSNPQQVDHGPKAYAIDLSENKEGYYILRCSLADRVFTKAIIKM